MTHHFSIGGIFRQYRSPKKEEETKAAPVKVQMTSPEPMQPEDHPLPIAIPSAPAKHRPSRPSPYSPTSWPDSSSIPARRRSSASYRTIEVPQPTVSVKNKPYGQDGIKRQPCRETSWTNAGSPDNYYTVITNSPTHQSSVHQGLSRKIPLDYRRKTGAARRASYADNASVVGAFSMMSIGQSPKSDNDEANLFQIVDKANKAHGQRRDSAVVQNTKTTSLSAAGSPPLRRPSITIIPSRDSGGKPEYAQSLDMNQLRRQQRRQSTASDSKPRGIRLPQYYARRHDSVRGDHYRITDEVKIEPDLHPNGGLGGYQDVQCNSAIGGYRNVDRFSDIGNDRFVKKMIFYKKYEYDEDIGGPLNHPKPSMIGGPLYHPRRSSIGHSSGRRPK